MHKSDRPLYLYGDDRVINLSRILFMNALTIVNKVRSEDLKHLYMLTGNS